MHSNASGYIDHQYKGIVPADRPKKAEQISTASYVD